MATLFDLIHDAPTVSDEFKGSPAWHIIEEAIRERIGEDDFAFGTTKEAWDFLCDNREHTPYAEEVGEIGGQTTIFDLVERFASVAAMRVAEEEAAGELSTLQSLVDYAEGEGFDLEGISTSCKLGWMSHKREEDWTLGNGDTATLYTWENVEGEPGKRYAVSVNLSDDVIWLDLSKEEE